MRPPRDIHVTKPVERHKFFSAPRNPSLSKNSFLPWNPKRAPYRLMSMDKGSTSVSILGWRGYDQYDSQHL